MFEDVSQARKNRLVGPAGRFPDPFPIPFAGMSREAPNEASSKQAAREVPLGGVRHEASREITADRGDSRMGDMRIGAGPDDLANDHDSVPSRLAVLHLIPTEFVLNMSLLEKFFSSRESQRLDSALSTICHIATLYPARKTGLLFSF
jgi:hypothetical protein